MHDFFQQEIARHEERERFWMASGRPGFAAGSARKAQKWRARARGLDLRRNGALPQDEVRMSLAHKMSAATRRLQVDFEYALFGSGSLSDRHR